MHEGIFFLKDYGRITVSIKETMESRGVTRNKLKDLTGLSYGTVDRYFKFNDEPMAYIDFDNLAKICYVLNCQISDILRYERP